MMSDPLDNTTNPQSVPVHDVTVRENEVKEELSGWYSRRCDRNAADSRKQYASWSMAGADGTVRLENQYQTGQSLELAQAWEQRAEAARHGIFLLDNAAACDPSFTADSAIKALQARAAVLGLVEYENPLREVGPRF
jgi:hypothetical protein